MGANRLELEGSPDSRERSQCTNIDFLQEARQQFRKFQTGANAFIGGTVDGVVSNGTENIVKHPEKAATQAFGAVAIGVALKAAPKWISIPAAIIGGAGTIGYCRDSADAFSRIVPSVQNAEKDPVLARAQIAKHMGPVAFEGISMLALGGIGASGTSKISSMMQTTPKRFLGRSVRASTYQLRDPIVSFSEKKFTAEVVFGQKPLTKVQLASLANRKFERKAFLDKDMWNIVTDEKTRHQMIGSLKPAHFQHHDRPGYVVIPTQSREFLGVSSRVVPSSSALGKLYSNSKESVVKLRTDDGGSATGFFVSEDGKIATALHTVEGASRIGVQTSEGTIYGARLVAHDFDSDLAVLMVDGATTRFKPLPLGNGARPADHEVFVLGHPAGSDAIFMSPGLYHRKGIANAVLESKKGDRLFYRGRDYQQDLYYAHARPGNSGAPVLNSKGEVLAVHTEGRYSDDIYMEPLKVGSGTSVRELNSLLASLPHKLPETHLMWSEKSLIPAKPKDDPLDWLQW